ncbi:relaxase/mobilization nuclease domain-containing protein [Gramella sp. GC03-9]|uniref:Relaxase/mobilization nuclease domain-containing protein n=1 Tax=Christiangramia oceanisediminis TaxID=2920386 RepID=A0A9X2RC67_9FLAO|nr:relaxase/mobilization nuclease domain-containing protein [Gramella oceanisediminis]MCP9200800.1 relaxase/mobilization nuclease domain-containing protein [Gramella oceanisediminis]
MIGKGQSISRTQASISYGWNQDKEAEVILKQHLAGDTPEQITDEFKIIQSQNDRCLKNTLSFVVSPTIKDGKNLNHQDLEKIAQRFIREMDLKNHQAIGFVHKDKEHTHIHIYANRISLKGEVYKDSFIGKRSQIAADNVAKQIGLTRVREVQHEKLQELKWQRLAIKHIHNKVLESRPKSLDEYIQRMNARNIKVIPSINKSNQLQGFRFEYKGLNLKGSEVHRSMSGNKLIAEISQNNSFSRLKEAPKTLKLANNTVQLSTNMLTKIAKDLAKQVIKRAIDTGMGMGY